MLEDVHEKVQDTHLKSNVMAYPDSQQHGYIKEWYLHDPLCTRNRKFDHSTHKLEQLQPA